MRYLVLTGLGGSGKLGNMGLGFPEVSELLLGLPVFFIILKALQFLHRNSVSCQGVPY
jgi:hypothetical protein